MYGKGAPDGSARGSQGVPGTCAVPSDLRAHPHNPALPEAGLRGQGEVGLRREEGGTHRNTSGQECCRRNSNIQKNFCFRSNEKRVDPYLATPASRPRAVLSSANLVGPTARGVPVASAVWLWPAGRVPVASPSGYREVDKGLWG